MSINNKIKTYKINRNTLQHEEKIKRKNVIGKYEKTVNLLRAKLTEILGKDESYAVFDKIAEKVSE